MSIYNFWSSADRFLGNKNTTEIHDKQNIKLLCEIDKIKEEHKTSFLPDTVQEAKNYNYDTCYWCFGYSKR